MDISSFVQKRQSHGQREFYSKLRDKVLAYLPGGAWEWIFKAFVQNCNLGGIGDSTQVSY